MSMTPRIILKLVLLWVVGACLPLSGAEYRVSSAASVASLIEKLRPGDTVVLSGQSSVTVTGEQVIVSGLYLKDGNGSGNGIMIGGSHCRLTETAVVGGTYKFFV